MPVTRTLLTAVLAGSLRSASFRTDRYFGFGPGLGELVGMFTTILSDSKAMSA